MTSQSALLAELQAHVGADAVMETLPKLPSDDTDCVTGEICTFPSPSESRLRPPRERGRQAASGRSLILSEPEPYLEIKATPGGGKDSSKNTQIDD
jgi:hypothetical protein